MEARKKIVPSTRMLTFKELQEPKVVAILLTMRSAEPHGSCHILLINWLLLGLYSKKF
jgi:hypothetical protein